MRADGPAGRTALAAAGARAIVAGRTAARLRQTIELADEAAAEWGRASLVYGQARAPALPAGARAHIVDVTDPCAGWSPPRLPTSSATTRWSTEG